MKITVAISRDQARSLQERARSQGHAANWVQQLRREFGAEVCLGSSPNDLDFYAEFPTEQAALLFQLRY